MQQYLKRSLEQVEYQEKRGFHLEIPIFNTWRVFVPPSAGFPVGMYPVPPTRVTICEPQGYIAKNHLDPMIMGTISDAIIHHPALTATQAFETLVMLL